ncbi:MAG: hypothetical protein M0026_16380 [Nocardiopsaceae bacterium]|nr:hypothetical protein [Nocardiopsaceae bacterium]
MLKPAPQRRVERLALVGVPVLAGAFVLLLAGAKWPRYWEWIAPEQTPMTWLESVLMVLCAGVALLLAAARYLRAEAGSGRWLVLAAGFAFLALDERFALHERVRDGYLAPRGATLPFLPWVAPGDFIILAYGVIGLALLPFVLPAFRGDRRSLRWLITGVVFAAAAVIGDSFNVHAMSPMVEARQQTLEEVAELASSVCFLLALWLRLVPVLTWTPVPQPAAAAVSHPDSDSDTVLDGVAGTGNDTQPGSGTEPASTSPG